MKKLIFIAVLTLVFFSSYVFAACEDLNDGKTESVAITSSTQGATVVSEIYGGCFVMVDPDTTTGSVWVAHLNGTCSSVMTKETGVPISQASGSSYNKGWEFLSKQGHVGKLCGILESGSTQINLCVNCW